MLNFQALPEGLKKVYRAKGAAGIDGQSLEQFASNWQVNLQTLQHELQTKQSRVQPVKWVELTKDDGGVRLLGIPAVRDRIVQQTLLNILQPIFDSDFHPSSYGYRPGRTSHDAISKATVFIRDYNRQWVVDMDLSKCFDKLDHEIIINSVKRKVTEGSILNLIKQFSDGGVMINVKGKQAKYGMDCSVCIYQIKIECELYSSRIRGPFVRFCEREVKASPNSIYGSSLAFTP